MYLRSTKRKNKNGTITEYLQLAHNVRDPETNSTVARIIHSFGRADQLDREALVRLARSIARVCGITILDADGDGDRHQGSGGLPDDLEILRTVELGTVLVIETCGSDWASARRSGPCSARASTPSPTIRRCWP